MKFMTKKDDKGLYKCIFFKNNRSSPKLFYYQKIPINGIHIICHDLMDLMGGESVRKRYYYKKSKLFKEIKKEQKKRWRKRKNE